MMKRQKGWYVIAAAMLLFAGMPYAQDEASLRKDLTSVIALLGLPCGQVIKVTTLGESDNLAVCQDGNRYRVFINEQGRVVAKRQ
jgi:hypothetical protein